MSKGSILVADGNDDGSIGSDDAAPPAGDAPLGDGGYRLTAMKQSGAPELLMMLTFSGGGKRSSAFSYGVLRGLRDIPIRIDGQEHRLLDEVSGIEAVQEKIGAMVLEACWKADFKVPEETKVR
mgnify:CR=1 FL=1